MCIGHGRASVCMMDEVDFKGRKEAGMHPTLIEHSILLTLSTLGRL